MSKPAKVAAKGDKRVQAATDQNQQTNRRRNAALGLQAKDDRTVRTVLRQNGTPVR